MDRKSTFHSVWEMPRFLSPGRSKLSVSDCASWLWTVHHPVKRCRIHSTKGRSRNGSRRPFHDSFVRICVVPTFNHEDDQEIFRNAGGGSIAVSIIGGRSSMVDRIGHRMKPLRPTFPLFSIWLMTRAGSKMPPIWSISPTMMPRQTTSIPIFRLFRMILLLEPLPQSCESDQLDCDPNWTFTWTIRSVTMARRSRSKLNTGDLPELRTHLILRISVFAISGSLVRW
jgi:hypothetical protein